MIKNDKLVLLTKSKINIHKKTYTIRFHMVSKVLTIYKTLQNIQDILTIKIRQFYTAMYALICLITFLKFFIFCVI